MVAIFVAFIFVSLILTELAIEKWQAWRVAHPSLSKTPDTRAVQYGFDALCQVPEGIRLSNQHTWVRPDAIGGLEVGADAFDRARGRRRPPNRSAQSWRPGGRRGCAHSPRARGPRC